MKRILGGLGKTFSIGGRLVRVWHPVLAGVLAVALGVPLVLAGVVSEPVPGGVGPADARDRSTEFAMPTPTPEPGKTTSSPTPAASSSPAPQPSTSTSPGSGSSAGGSATTSPSPTPGSVTCSLVIGFSQTRDWFTQLEATASSTGIDPARWELLGAGGAGVNRWADANNDVWEREIRSPCSRNADAPERAVFTISAQIYEENVDWWTEQIRDSVAQIRAHYPSVRQIVLQPVVGGPRHERCVDPATNETIRATFNHPFIHQAIGRNLGGSVVRGADPHVQACSQYADAVGHLTDDGYAYIGRRLGGFYARFPNPS